MSNGACNTFDCIGSILFVSFLWGSTNPFLRRGVKNTEESTPSTESTYPRLIRPILHLAKLISNWRVFLPLAINQSGSILFVVITSSYPISLVVPLVNSIQLVFTVIVGVMLGERLTYRTLVGCIFIATGVTFMLIDQNRDR